MTGFMKTDHSTPMQRALEAARQAAAAGEVPVGAAIVHKGEVLLVQRNRMLEMNRATAHAEILAITGAMDLLGVARLVDCDLYVTLEPCTMCAGAIAHARLRRVCFGAQDRKAGAVENGVQYFDQPSCHHRPEVISGLGESASQELLRAFFAARR